MFSGVGSVSAVVLYNVTDLGTLGGTSSAARSINNRGDVVGWASTTTGAHRACIWQSSGGLQGLDTFGGDWSEAWYVNNSGQVVGDADRSSNEQHAFLWQDSTGMQDLTAPNPAVSDARGINDNGQIVGCTYIGSSARSYVSLWQTGGAMQNLGTLGGSYASGWSINNAGQVVGSSATVNGYVHPFVWQSDSGMQDLGTLGGNQGVAFHINESGQVVGWSSTSSGENLPYHAVLWKIGGKMEDLGTLGGADSIAYDIDNSGQVVGYDTDIGHAFIWQADIGMQDLNNLIGSPSGWTLVAATAINDNGWIVGYGTTPAGQSHAFLLTPVPEPSTLVLLGVGAVILLAFAWRRRRGRARCLSCAAVVVAMLIAGSAQADVFNMGGTRDPMTGTWTGLASLEFVTVGDPGNAADTVVMLDGTTGYGSVGYTYQMGTYDVTAGQYTAFLNAVAAQDTYGLYNSGMAVVGGSTYGCGIIQSGSSGSYTYAVATAYQNFPVNCVSWGDAARFCNWLQNGQRTGSEGTATTEMGAYTLNGAVTYSALMAITRNTGATYVIPSENEWYKAAYYDPTLDGGAGGYWSYPTKSNTAPINILSPTGTNNANFWDYYGTGNGGYTDPTNYLTPVGAFAASPGPYGTYDMGGDLFQWNEASIESGYRGLRGGNWCYSSNILASSVSYEGTSTGEYNAIGFRVASLPVPEPGGIALVVAGGLSLLAYAWRRRRG